MGSSFSDTKTPLLESETLETQTRENPQNPPLMDLEKEKPVDDTEQSEEGEEEGECGFCLYMKAGGCKETFTAWEDCIKEAGEKDEDVVEKCAQITGKLKLCMEANEEYYAPILLAEKAAEAQVNNELEMEKNEEEASKKSQQGSGN